MTTRIAWFGHGEGRRSDGLSSYSREVVRALERRGMEVRFFFHDSDGSRAPIKNVVELKGNRVGAATISAPGTMKRIVGELEDFAPDIVHTSWSFSQHDGRLGRWARDNGVGAFATYHVAYTENSLVLELGLKMLYRYQARQLMGYDGVIALSQGQRTLLIKAGLSSEKITVLNNAVDTDVITPGHPTLKSEFAAEFVVFYMGRLDPEKRITTLVRSFLSLGWPDDHVLVIAGHGSQAEKLRRMTDDHENVRMVGLITDPAIKLGLLRSADVFVQPSIAEGLSLSLLEAMAAGCAVVATDVGEDGTALGDAGVVIPAKRIRRRLVSELQRLEQDSALRKSLGVAARKRAEEHFSLAVHIDRLLALYEKAGSN